MIPTSKLKGTDKYFFSRIVLANKSLEEIIEALAFACYLNITPIVRIYDRTGQIITAVRNLSYERRNGTAYKKESSLININKRNAFNQLISNNDIQFILSRRCTEFNHISTSQHHSIFQAIKDYYSQQPEIMSIYGVITDTSQFYGKGGVDKYEEYISKVMKHIQSSTASLMEVDEMIQNEVVLLYRKLSILEEESKHIEVWVDKHWAEHVKEHKAIKEVRSNYFDKPEIIKQIQDYYADAIPELKKEIMKLTQ